MELYWGFTDVGWVVGYSEFGGPKTWEATLFVPPHHSRSDFASCDEACEQLLEWFAATNPDARRAVDVGRKQADKVYQQYANDLVYHVASILGVTTGEIAYRAIHHYVDRLKAEIEGDSVEPIPLLPHPLSEEQKQLLKGVLDSSGPRHDAP